MTKRRNPSKMPSVRQLRVGEEIRRLMSQILFREDVGMLIPRARDIILSEIRISADLRIARCFVSLVPHPCGTPDVPQHARGTKKVPQKKEEDFALSELIPLLSKHQRFFKEDIAKKASLQFIPHLLFLEDEVPALAAKVDALFHLEKVQQDVQPHESDDDHSS